jgi:hypothetical protein
VILLLPLLACGTAAPAVGGPVQGDPARFVAGLSSGDCTPVADPALRDDCRVSTAKAPADCEVVADATLRGECWFRLAEKGKDPALCPKAAPFADDCALHVLSAAFPKWIPKGTRPGDHDDDAAAQIAAAGLAADDMRPWSAWYRWVLLEERPLDRAGCANVADAARREACLHTGIALYQDLLNRARDRHTYPCDGGALPGALQTTPDPELDALRAARTDLCTPR